MPVKVTMFFQCGNYSWSEAHYFLGSSTFNGSFQQALALVKVRIPLLGTFAQLTNCRLSYVPANRQVDDLDPASFGNNTQIASGSSQGNLTSDLPGTALLVNFQSATSNKNLFLAGVPDDVVQTDPDYPNSYVPTAAFASAFNDYKTFLCGSLGTNQWGFRSVVKGAGVKILSLGTQAGFGNNIGLVSAADLGAPVGSELYLSGFRRNNPRSPGLSGPFEVVGIIPPGSGTPTFTTVLNETGNVNADNFFKLGSATPLVFNYIPYTNCRVVRATTRKRGGSFGRPRGRLPARR